MKTFEELWHDLEERSRRFCIPIVQDYKELEYVFNLIKGCSHYLEVGTAEGSGLYVLAHALGKPYRLPYISIVDYGEKHTSPARDEVIEKLRTLGASVYERYGNSHCKGIIEQIQTSSEEGLFNYDVVFIDAGHSYEDVIADAIAYGHLATKYIIFHDVCMPPVKAAIEWYLAQNPQFKYHEFINSKTYGYGIIEV